MSEKKLKILQVVDNYFPIIDGVVFVVANYARCMNEKNECEVLVPYYPKYVDNQPFKVQRSSSVLISKKIPRLPIPFFDRKIRKFLKEGNFDIINAHSPVTLGRFVAKYAKKHNIPICFTMHTKFHEEINRTMPIKLFQKIALKYILSTINKMDYVITVSEDATSCLKSYGYTGKSEVIRNGTDLKYPTNDITPMINEITAEYKLDNVEHVFLFVGRIVVVKKIQNLLRIMCILKQRLSSFKLLVVGDGDYLDELKKMASELDLDDNVIFTGKITDRNKLSAFYLRSDLFLFPSTFDTASLVALEAAALKLPALLVRGCSSAEIITDNVSGYLCEEGDLAWANRIEEIVKDKSALLAAKEAAYDQIYKSWETISDEVVVAYRKNIEDYKIKHTK